MIEIYGVFFFNPNFHVDSNTVRTVRNIAPERFSCTPLIRPTHTHTQKIELLNKFRVVDRPKKDLLVFATTLIIYLWKTQLQPIHRCNQINCNIRILLRIIWINVRCKCCRVCCCLFSFRFSFNSFAFVSYLRSFALLPMLHRVSGMHTSMCVCVCLAKLVFSYYVAELVYNIAWPRNSFFFEYKKTPDLQI